MNGHENHWHDLVQRVLEYECKIGVKNINMIFMIFMNVHEFSFFSPA